jgi:hypothetical protein
MMTRFVPLSCFAICPLRLLLVVLYHSIGLHCEGFAVFFKWQFHIRATLRKGQRPLGFCIR